MKRAIGLGCLALLAGCAATTSKSPPTATETACNAAPAQSKIGAPVTDALGPELLRLTGARTLRVIGPGMAVTQDYRVDRLNIHHDDRKIIERIGCG